MLSTRPYLLIHKLAVFTLAPMLVLYELFNVVIVNWAFWGPAGCWFGDGSLAFFFLLFGVAEDAGGCGDVLGD